MVNRKDSLSLGSVFACLAIGLPSPFVNGEALAFDLTFNSPVCAEINLPIVAIPPCDGVYFLRTGRMYYGPFLQDGSPIEISAEALTWDYPGSRLPLFFELMQDCNVCNFDCRGAGALVWEAFGELDCQWSTSGRLNVSLRLFPEGSLYWIRVTSFGRIHLPGEVDQYSPALRDVRVRTLPRSPVIPATWGVLKRLYQ